MVNKETPGDAPAPSRADMVRRARDWVPVLRERSQLAEETRTLAAETKREFLDAGFHRIFQPKRYGGYELDFISLIEISAEIGRGCGSSAWVFANVMEHARLNGMRNPRAQDDLWQDNPDALTCASFPAETAKVTQVEGGIVLDGDWAFASGIDVAEWNDFNVLLPRGEGQPPEHHFALVPVSEIEVIDDWFVTGLVGTASKRTRVRELFVPAHRLVSTEKCRGGPTEGSAVNPGPLYRTPVYALGSKIFSGANLGMARGALELTMADVESRVAVSGLRVAEQSTVQSRIAQADAELEAAWTLLSNDCENAMQIATAGETPDLAVRMRWRRNDAYATKLCLQAVQRLHTLAGARRMTSDNLFQRAFRDLHAGAAQVQVNWDLQSTNFGRVAFGLPPLDSRV